MIDAWGGTSPIGAFPVGAYFAIVGATKGTEARSLFRSDFLILLLHSRTDWRKASSRAPGVWSLPSQVGDLSFPHLS